MSELDLLLFSGIQKAKGAYYKVRNAIQHDINPKVLELSNKEAGQSFMRHLTQSCEFSLSNQSELII